MMSLNTGYQNKQVDVNDAMYRLALYIKNIPEYFNTISPAELLRKTNSTKWSKKEILGHLIDSAINNLKRFTDIQFSPQPCSIISYNQVELVTVNNYQELEMAHLINLWKSLNQQILFVVANISQEKLLNTVNIEYDDPEVKTLGWVICDYVAHMEHHYKQINENIVFI